MERKKLRVAAGLAGLAILVAALLLGRVYYARVSTEDPAQSNTAPQPEIGNAFSLIDHTGRAVTDDDFRGQFMLVFFGYTYCPDVCPTSLQNMSDALNALGAAADKVQPIFITVDPERDTVAVMADYVTYFHPRLFGLTGTRQQVAGAAKAYRVGYYKVYCMPVPGEDTDDEENACYSVSHSAETYLMGPDGRLRAVFPFGTNADEMAAGIREQLDKHMQVKDKG